MHGIYCSGFFITCLINQKTINMKYDLEPMILNEKPNNPKKLIRKLEKDLNSHLKKQKFQTAHNTLCELFDAYYYDADYMNQLKTLCCMSYFTAHNTIDLDGSTGTSLKQMQDYGMLPLDGIEDKTFPPGYLYDYCALIELLDIDILEIEDVFIDINKVYSNSGLFAYSALALWNKLEEAIEEYDKNRAEN